MSGIRQIACCLALLYSTAVLSQEISSVELENDVIQQGDDVIVRCVIGDYRVGSTIYWWKRQGEEQVQMGTNDLINDIFFNTGRYFSRVEEGDEPVFVVEIRGAEAEDSGEIGCSVARSSQDPVFATLHVVVPVEEMSFSSTEADGTVIHEYIDGMVVPFNEGDEYHFRCSVSGSNPAPAITMTLGDDDISSYFDIEDNHEVTGGELGLQQIHYSSVATTHTAVHVAGYANAQDFRCTASVPFVDDVSIGITPSLKFSPTLNCPEAVVEPVFSQNVEIICIAKANPFVTFESVHWFRKDQSNITLTADKKQSGHYTFHIEEGDTEDEKVLRLVIDRATYQAFREYTFIVKNDLGDVTKTVPLARDFSGESTDGASSQQTWLLFTLMTSFAAYLVR